VTGKIIRVVVGLGLAAAAAGSLVITSYLGRLDRGIESDVVAVERMVEGQRAIQKQNEILGDMVTATRSIGGGLDQVIKVSEGIGGHVGAVGKANQSTLTLNDAMIANNLASATDLARVVAALRQMNQSAAAIEQYLAALRETAAADVRHLETIAANTARMNAKTPGW